MPLSQVEEIIASLMIRRDAMSIKAAKAIRALQSEASLAYAKGWDAAISAAITAVKED